jgi:hypothetical protein
LSSYDSNYLEERDEMTMKSTNNEMDSTIRKTEIDNNFQKILTIKEAVIKGYIRVNPKYIPTAANSSSRNSSSMSNSLLKLSNNIEFRAETNRQQALMKLNSNPNIKKKHQELLQNYNKR